MQNLLNSKNHRTLLVIDARGELNSEAKERVNRLLQSVNGPNIKVDIAHLTGDGGSLTIGGLNNGVTLKSGLPAQLGGNTDGPDTADNGSIYDAVIQAGKDAGYVQVLISATR